MGKPSALQTECAWGVVEEEEGGEGEESAEDAHRHRSVLEARALHDAAARACVMHHQQQHQHTSVTKVMYARALAVRLV